MSKNTKKNVKPRGFFAEDTSKYTDQNPTFYYGDAMKYYWPIYKYAVLAIIYY